MSGTAAILRLMQKRAVITGASSGIGWELAKELSRRGYALALLARRADLLEQLTSELTLAGGTAIAVPCDVADRESVLEAVRRGAEQSAGRSTSPSPTPASVRRSMRPTSRWPTPSRSSASTFWA